MFGFGEGVGSPPPQGGRFLSAIADMHGEGGDRDAQAEKRRAYADELAAQVREKEEAKAALAAAAAKEEEADRLAEAEWNRRQEEERLRELDERRRKESSVVEQHARQVEAIAEAAESRKPQAKHGRRSGRVSSMTEHDAEGRRWAEQLLRDAEGGSGGVVPSWRREDGAGGASRAGDLGGRDSLGGNAQPDYGVYDRSPSCYPPTAAGVGDDLWGIPEASEPPARRRSPFGRGHAEASLLPEVDWSSGVRGLDALSRLRAELLQERAALANKPRQPLWDMGWSPKPALHGRRAASAVPSSYEHTAEGRKDDSRYAGEGRRGVGGGGYYDGRGAGAPYQGRDVYISYDGFGGGGWQGGGYYDGRGAGVPTGRKAYGDDDLAGHMASLRSESHFIRLPVGESGQWGAQPRGY